MGRDHPYVKPERAASFALCHKLLPAMQIKVQCLLGAVQRRGCLLAPGGELQH